LINHNDGHIPQMKNYLIWDQKAGLLSTNRLDCPQHWLMLLAPT